MEGVITGTFDMDSDFAGGSELGLADCLFQILTVEIAEKSSGIDSGLIHVYLLMV